MHSSEAGGPEILCIMHQSLTADPCCCCAAVQYGLEQINDDVSAWMRGTRNADGNLRKPPFLAMG